MATWFEMMEAMVLDEPRLMPSPEGVVSFGNSKIPYNNPQTLCMLDDICSHWAVFQNQQCATCSDLENGEVNQ